MSKNEYKLPMNVDDIVWWSGTEEPSHTGNFKHSLDFMSPEGKDIYAARDGKVVWLKKDSVVGGDDPQYFDEGNRIVLQHENGEFTAYEHMKSNGVFVEVGDQVKVGQKIGEVGNTGYSSEPHLHFEVFVDPDEWMSEGVTIPVKFPEVSHLPTESK